MQVGILGSGAVGQALGRGFVSRGHDVMVGSRTPDSEKLQTWRKEVGSQATTGTFAETAEFGEVLVLAVLGTAAETVLNLADPANFAEKVVLDVTNPLDFAGEGPPGLFVGLTDSLGERVQRRLPDAKVVKAFNIVPNSVMVDPDLPGGPPDMIICGDDPDAKAQITEFLQQFGWPGAIDIGGIQEARWLEAFVPLWGRVAMALNNWTHDAGGGRRGGGAVTKTLSKDVHRALATERTIDITTVGRKTGLPRRIEIWFHNVDGRIFITGIPGPRSWYANLLAHPQFTFHLKRSIHADLPARARPIRDQKQRREVLETLVPLIGGRNPEAWIARSPLVEVTFDVE